MKVLIAVPHTGVLRAELVSWLVKTIMNHPDWGLDLSYGIPLDSNRNQIVKKFLTLPKFTHLLMVDSDIVPPLGAVERLLSHNKRIVGGVCFSSKNNIPYPVVMKRNDEGWEVAREKLASGKRLIDVDAVGGVSVLLVHRSVYSKMKPPWFKFSYDRNGICNITEDFNWCLRAKKLGYKIYVDLTVRCAHFKTLDLMSFNQLLGKTAKGDV